MYLTRNQERAFAHRGISKSLPLSASHEKQPPKGFFMLHEPRSERSVPASVRARSRSKAATASSTVTRSITPDAFDLRPPWNLVGRLAEELARGVVVTVHAIAQVRIRAAARAGCSRHAGPAPSSPSRWRCASGPESGVITRSARASSAGNCFSVSLPTRSSAGRLHRGEDRVGGLAFERAATTAHHDAPTARGRVVGNRGVTFGRQLRTLAGTRRHQQRRRAVVRPLRARPFVRGVRARAGATTCVCTMPSGSQKLPIASSTWMPGRSGMRSLTNNPCRSLSARVVADAPLRRNEGRQHVRARSATCICNSASNLRPSQPATHREHAADSAALVVDDELDARQTFQQLARRCRSPT